MFKLETISYEEERLSFFIDQQKVVQKRYKRLEKGLSPDEPYLSERRHLLSECGRELSFYNDVISMLQDELNNKNNKS